MLGTCYTTWLSKLFRTKSVSEIIALRKWRIDYAPLVCQKRLDPDPESPSKSPKKKRTKVYDPGCSQEQIKPSECIVKTTKQSNIESCPPLSECGTTGEHTYV
ncbi:MAG: hypothetical protein GY816_11680 [Cytophagales bacterium]|nr:hypothetical protein [Cytophagales bacterium]